MNAKFEWSIKSKLMTTRKRRQEWVSQIVGKANENFYAFWIFLHILLCYYFLLVLELHTSLLSHWWVCTRAREEMNGEGAVKWHWMGFKFPSCFAIVYDHKKVSSFFRLHLLPLRIVLGVISWIIFMSWIIFSDRSWLILQRDNKLEIEIRDDFARHNNFYKYVTH